MKQKNPIEENQKLRTDNNYLRVRFKEVKEKLKEKDEVIRFLKKNLGNMKTKTRPLLLFLFT